MLLSHLNHLTRAAAAGVLSILTPALTGADVVISDPETLPPENHPTFLPTSSSKRDCENIVKGIIRNQVAGLLSSLLLSKENLDPELQNLIPILQNATLALNGMPASSQRRRPRGTRGGGGRQGQRASRTRPALPLRATPNVGRKVAPPSTLPTNLQPPPASLNAHAPSWPRGLSLTKQASSQKQHRRGTHEGRRKQQASRTRPMQLSSRETPNEGPNVCSRTTRTTTNEIPPHLLPRAPSPLNANAPPWPRGQPLPAQALASEGPRHLAHGSRSSPEPLPRFGRGGVHEYPHCGTRISHIPYHGTRSSASPNPLTAVAFTTQRRSSARLSPPNANLDRLEPRQISAASSIRVWTRRIVTPLDHHAPLPSQPFSTCSRRSPIHSYSNA